MSFSGIALPFTSGAAYATGTTTGLIVGKTYMDESTGYEYVWTQMHTDMTNDTSAVGEIAVQVSATQKGIVTNKASVGLDTTYPIGLGIFISIIPESTATTTYYGWVIKQGYVATLLNDGTDQTVGDNLYVVAADPASAGRLAGTATNTDDGVLNSIFGRAATTVTGTNSTAYVNFNDI